MTSGTRKVIRPHWGPQGFPASVRPFNGWLACIVRVALNIRRLQEPFDRHAVHSVAFGSLPGGLRRQPTLQDEVHRFSRMRDGSRTISLESHQREHNQLRELHGPFDGQVERALQTRINLSAPERSTSPQPTAKLTAGSAPRKTTPTILKSGMSAVRGYGHAIRICSRAV